MRGSGIISARAARVSFLLEGAAYMEAVARAMLCARRELWIVGWDLHEETALLAPGACPEGLPERLLPRLLALLAREPRLTIRLLLWSCSPLLLPEGQPVPAWTLRRHRHPRLLVALDEAPLLGACLHQKLVVVDGAAAFLGGIDLTLRRWDTPAHVAPPGAPPTWRPLHDLGVARRGAAAERLRARASGWWAEATGEAVDGEAVDGEAGEGRACHEAGCGLCHDVYRDMYHDIHHDTCHDMCHGAGGGAPAEASLPALRDLPVELAWHDPAPGAPRPLADALLRAVQRAERWILLESPYLSWLPLVEALEARLAAPAPPQVLIILPARADSALERWTLDRLRGPLLARLEAADGGRGLLRVAAPWRASSRQPVYVHAKLWIVDGRFGMIGSANLARRSMEADAELGLLLRERGDGQVEAALHALARRVLAGHTTQGGALRRLRPPRRASRLLLTLARAADPGRRGLGGVHPLRRTLDDAASLPGRAARWAAFLGLAHLAPPLGLGRGAGLLALLAPLGLLGVGGELGACAAGALAGPWLGAPAALAALAALTLLAWTGGAAWRRTPWRRSPGRTLHRLGAQLRDAPTRHAAPALAASGVGPARAALAAGAAGATLPATLAHLLGGLGPLYAALGALGGAARGGAWGLALGAWIVALWCAGALQRRPHAPPRSSA